MFQPVVNLACNNKLFTVYTIPGMHPSAERLYLAAKELQGIEGQSNLARLLNESPQTVNNWEVRGVSKQGAMNAQQQIGCDANWVRTGTGAMVRATPRVSAPLFASEPWTEYPPVPASRYKFVPVVGQGAGGSLPERIWTDGDFPVGATNEYAEVLSLDPHAFIVRVVGPSMVPKFNPGDFALVEPSSEPDIEDDVLVRLSNGQTLLKQLLSRRGSHVRLGSYNDREVLVFEKTEVTFIYYVAYPVPARKIKTRI